MKNILITGGSGFFGRGFVRHLLKHYPATERICIYSRGEHAQAEMRQEFGDDERLRWFIGDIRDRDRLRRAMSGIDVVVHAAALKRIEVGAYNPVEMVLTNVNGAINVVEAARDARVPKVVALSTDKAYQPISPYGYSKAMAEAIFLAANDNHGTLFTVTRYGNVAGSSGSVIPKWRKHLQGSHYVPVTDGDCTRFWMTLQQAIDLVATTIEEMKGGETVIPDLQAYQIGDLALAMGAWGAQLPVMGLPSYEKKHESMSDSACSNDPHRRLTVDQLRELVKQV